MTAVELARFGALTKMRNYYNELIHDNAVADPVEATLDWARGEMPSQIVEAVAKKFASSATRLQEHRAKQRD